MVKRFLLRSVCTDSTNGSVFNALLIALLHSEHVSPLACNSALLNWACTFDVKHVTIAIPREIKIVFILHIFLLNIESLVTAPYLLNRSGFQYQILNMQRRGSAARDGMSGGEN